MRFGDNHRFIVMLVIAMSLISSLSSACRAQRPYAASESLGYVPASEAAQTLDAAKRDASASGKRILIIAGGDWCRWCHVLDRFLHETLDIQAQWRESFVVVKYEAGENGDGNSVLDTLPATNGYPHFWVLAADGSLIASVETGPLERGDDDYDPRAFREFLKQYGLREAANR